MKPTQNCLSYAAHKQTHKRRTFRGLLLFQKFTAKSASERTVKIGQHLAKLEAKIHVEWHFFR